MPKSAISLAGRWVGASDPPLVIAEMSGNHNQSLDRALAIVGAAAKAGAHALKIQTYTADTMTLDLERDGFLITDSSSLWQGKSLYRLYQEAFTPWEWHKPIFDRVRELGMVAFSTPFDETAVDFLESLDVPCYKIASFENTDIPLIRKVAATGKPLIISTGMATMVEIEEAVQAARNAGATQIALLKCTSAYPALPEEMNLRTIPHLAEAFGVPVGLSDHTMDVAIPMAAVALGACIIEKHFTLSRDVPGPDSAFSLEPHEFKAMVDGVRTAEKALGNVKYGITEHEAASRVFRRSLFVVKDVKTHEAFSTKNVRAIRPGLGLPPKFLPLILERQARKTIKKGTPLSWDLLE